MSFRAFLVLAFLFSNVFVIQIFNCLIQLSCLSLLNRKIHLKLIRFSQRAFVEVIVLLCFLFHKNNQLLLYGDEILTDNSIFISNHQIYADWMYLWLSLMEYNWHGYLKIILKRELKRVPFFGWGMSLYEFVFLERTWQKDKRTLCKHFERIKDDKCRMCLLIFPEGTVICQETIDKNKEYIKKHDIKFESKHVLMPRSTGLEFCVRNLDGNVKHIYDLTLAFSGLSADETPMDKYSLSNMFVHGVVPAQVHLRVRRIPVAEVKPLINTAAESQVVSAVAAVDDQTLLKYAGRLPTLNHSSPKFDAWLLETYNRKDKEMEAFYRDARFPDSPYRVISFGSWEWAWALISRDFSLLKLYTALIVLVLVFRWYYY